MTSRRDAFQAEMQRLLNGDRHFAIDEMARRGWCVAAMPDSISDPDAAGIASAAARRGITSAVAGTTESEDEQLDLVLTPDAIIAFDRNALLRYYLLVAEQRFAILLEANYYWLLAAPADFIEEALGKPATALLHEFLTEYADATANDWPPRTAAVLREMERYLPLCSR